MSDLASIPVAILAGGFGTRMQEETITKPKPMVEIGGRPILWHIMKMYASFGCREFVIALGYKGELIKDYFLHYNRRASNFSIALKDGHITVHSNRSEDWIVHLLDTGLHTQTAGRVRQVANFLNGRRFMLTYGDGVANVAIPSLVSWHVQHGAMGTVTAVRPPARFGGLSLAGERVVEFVEKPQLGEGWVNGGFFVLEPNVVDYLTDDLIAFEREPLRAMVADRKLIAFQHPGYWQCMDTVRDLQTLEGLWQQGQAPWKTWSD